jgi:maltose-binding protein MalE
LKKLEDEYPTVIKTDLIEKNNLYGAPLSIDTLALYYNRNFLDQAGIALKPQT